MSHLILLLYSYWHIFPNYYKTFPDGLLELLMICDIKNMNRGDRKYGQCDDGWKITCDEIGNKNDFPGQNGLA
jgi:hypothetical protein